MKESLRKLKVAAFGLAGAALLVPALVMAQQQDDGQSFSAELGPLNGSGASGQAQVQVQEDGQVSVTVSTSNVSPGLAHAQHIHIGGENTCPTSGADTDGDGLITTVEGQPFYGDIAAALTMDGDVGGDSALALDRMPTADDTGSYEYERTFELPEGTDASNLQNGVIVVHGYAALSGDETQYDGDRMSPLDESVPLEATLPVLCGELQPAQQQGTPGAGTPADGTETPADGTPADGTQTPADGTPAAGTQTPADGTPADGTQTPADGTPADGTQTPADGTPADGTQTPGQTATASPAAPGAGSGLMAEEGSSTGQYMLVLGSVLMIAGGAFAAATLRKNRANGS